MLREATAVIVRSWDLNFLRIYSEPNWKYDASFRYHLSGRELQSNKTIGLKSASPTPNECYRFIASYRGFGVCRYFLPQCQFARCGLPHDHIWSFRLAYWGPVS
jgi:hypothetical protein